VQTVIDEEQPNSLIGINIATVSDKQGASFVN